MLAHAWLHINLGQCTEPLYAGLLPEMEADSLPVQMGLWLQWSAFSRHTLVCCGCCALELLPSSNAANG